MRCINCNNVIPEASTSCPYCSTKVDPNMRPAPVVNINDVDDLNFNDKLDLMKKIKEPSNKKRLIVFSAVVIALVIVVAFLIMTVFGSSSSTNFFSALINETEDFLEDNFIGNNAIGSGTYNITIKKGDSTNEIDGSYAFDTKNKLGVLNGKIKDPTAYSGGIVVDPKVFNFDLYLKNDSLYGLFNQLYDKYILFPIDDQTGLLKTKNYDLASLTRSVLDAFDTVTKNTSFVTEKNVSIEYRGNETTKVNKKTILLNQANKKKLYTLFYNTLLDDANFVNEMARISDKKVDEIKQNLQNEITTIDYKYDGTSSKETRINAYYSGSKLYRIEIDRTKEDEGDLLYIDLGETKYYLTYEKDGEKVFDLTIAILSKEVQDIINKTITITYMPVDSEKIEVIVKLQIDTKPSLKKTEITDEVNIRDLTVEDITRIKGNLTSYVNDETLLDSIIDKFKNKCSKELNCNCDDSKDTCECMYEGSIISCPRDIVKAE